MDPNGVSMPVFSLNVWLFFFSRRPFSRLHFDARGKWCQVEDLAVLLEFTATILDTQHHIRSYQANLGEFLYGSHGRGQDQPECPADLDLRWGKSESGLDCDDDVMDEDFFMTTLSSTHPSSGPHLSSSYVVSQPLGKNFGLSLLLIIDTLST